MTTIDGLAGRVAEARANAGHPIVVGVSGFGGSGKSSLAAALTAALPGAVGLRGDDFLDPVQSHHRSSDWAGVERARLADEVLRPFREGRPTTFRPFDWASRALGAPRPVPSGDILIVDLIGLLHPDLDGLLDLSMWCDVDLTTATAWGKARDARLGRNHDHLWDEVWVPNERDFVERFDPRRRADLIVAPLPAGRFRRRLSRGGSRLGSLVMRIGYRTRSSSASTCRSGPASACPGAAGSGASQLVSPRRSRSRTPRPYR